MLPHCGTAMYFLFLRPINLTKTMKTIITVGIVMVIVIGGMTFKSNTTEVTNVEVKVPTADEQLEQAVQKMIEEAVTASSTDITTAKEKAAQEVEDKMKKEIEATVRATIRNKVDPN